MYLFNLAFVLWPLPMLSPANGPFMPFMNSLSTCPHHQQCFSPPSLPHSSTSFITYQLIFHFRPRDFPRDIICFDYLSFALFAASHALCAPSPVCLSAVWQFSPPSVGHFITNVLAIPHRFGFTSSSSSSSSSSLILPFPFHSRHNLPSFPGSSLPIPNFSPFFAFLFPNFSSDSSPLCCSLLKFHTFSSSFFLSILHFL